MIGIYAKSVLAKFWRLTQPFGTGIGQLLGFVVQHARYTK
jgi:hypothetical protein